MIVKLQDGSVCTRSLTISTFHIKCCLHSFWKSLLCDIHSINRHQQLENKTKPTNCGKQTGTYSRWKCVEVTGEKSQKGFVCTFPWFWIKWWSHEESKNKTHNRYVYALSVMIPSALLILGKLVQRAVEKSDGRLGCGKGIRGLVLLWDWLKIDVKEPFYSITDCSLTKFSTFWEIKTLACQFCTAVYSLFTELLLQARSIRTPLGHNLSKSKAPCIFDSSSFLCVLRPVWDLKASSLILPSLEFNIILTFLIFWV